MRTRLPVWGLVALATIITVSFATAAQAQQVRRKNLSRQADVTILSGEPLEHLWGRKIEQLRLMAWRGEPGNWQAVPYQIDKRDADGDFMISAATIPQAILEETGYDNKPEPRKREGRIAEFESNRKKYEKLVAKGEMTQAELEELKRQAYFVEDIGALDYNDELVFMARDSGDRVAPKDWIGEDGIELEITDPLNGRKGWVYLFHFPVSAPPKSPVDYVRYDPEADTVQSNLSTIDFIDNKPMIIESLIHKLPDGTKVANVLDRFKLRINIEPRLLFCAGIHFDENNTKSFTIGYKDGPVRVLRRNIFWIVIGGVRLPFAPKAIVYYVFYENGLVGPAELDIPIDPGFFLCDGSRFAAGLDFRSSIKGAHVVTTDNPDGTLIIDGKTTEIEKNMTVKEQHWVSGYLPQYDSAIVARLFYDDKLRQASGSFDFAYIDDDERIDDPEAEPGSYFMGYTADLTKFPKGRFSVVFHIYIQYDFEPGDEIDVLNILDHPLEVRGTARPAETKSEARMSVPGKG